MARRRRNKRYRRGRLTVPLRFFSLLLICGAIVAAMILFFKVQTVTVVGNQRYQTEKILEVAAIETGENLFLLNKFEISRQITKKLPYVETVTIHRSLPDGVEIQVTEAKPMAVVSFEGNNWLISTSGKLLEKIKTTEVKEYPVVVGVEPLLPTVSSTLELPADGNITKEGLMSLFEALSQRKMLENVQKIDCTSGEKLVIRYLDRFDVEILYDADFGKKLNALQQIVDTLEVNETGTVILTMPDKMSFKPHALS